MPRATLPLALLLSLAAAGASAPLAAAEAPAAGDQNSPAYWLPAQRELARLADGWLVWESRRTGAWRIWTMRLDGTGTRQLTADEPGRDHYCPKLSPDGKRLIYLSLTDEAQKDNLDRPRDLSGPLHLINVDGSDDRVIVATAQKYNGWDRAVTWFDDQHLAFIDERGDTHRLDLANGQRELLIQGGQCWLPNTRMTHAVWSFNTFSLLDPARKTVTPMPHLGGCQPYFTHDGNWGFWVRAPGGPLYKMHLATRAISPLVDGALLPATRNYCYFPMISLNQRLVAFAAADHDKIIGAYGGYVLSDYEVFLLPIDPRTLEPLGTPIRYTFDARCDRFPDVYQGEPALGYHADEAPFAVQFPAAGDDAAWDYGDGAHEQAKAGKHEYAQPGVYVVEARRGDRVLRGQVRVAPASPPRVTGSVLEGDRELVVTFSEPVELAGLKLKLASGARVEKWAAGDDQRSLRVTLAEKPRQSDRLSLDGVADRAQHPNPMPAGSVDVIARAWPSNPAGLALLWEGADKPNTLRDPLTNQIAAYAPKANGRAWIDRQQAMVLDGGSYYFQGLVDQIANAVRKSNELSLELTLSPEASDAQRPRCVLTYGLYQVQDRLLLSLNGKQVELCTLPPGRASHVAIVYRPGQLVCYRDGQQVSATDQIVGDLSGYPSGGLAVGNNLDGQPWRGTLEGLAFYCRALTADEARTNAQAYHQMRKARPKSEPLELEARLIAASSTPTLKEIEPYRQALVVNEYEVLRVLRGEYATPKIRVAHWALLDETTQPVARLPLGTRLKLLAEPFVDQPQLTDQYCSNTLEDDFDLPLYYSVADPDSNRAVHQWNALAVAGGDSSDAFNRPGELEGKLNLPDGFPAPKDRSWQTVEAGPDGYVNLIGLERAGTGLGYAVVHVRSPGARRAKISFGTVGGLKAWLNGREVLAGQFGRYPLLGFREVDVELTAGWNELLVKSAQLYAFWGFRCELLDEHGKSLTDLEYAISRSPASK